MDRDPGRDGQTWYSRTVTEHPGPHDGAVPREGAREPLFFCSDLRVDRLGAPEVDGLTLTAEGRSACVLGAPRALLLAAAGQLLPSRGQLRIRGSRPRALLSRGELATAFFTDLLESSRTVLDHLHASADLAGTANAQRDALVADALTRMKLDAFRGTKLEKASAMVRRGTHLAAALATGAGTLVLSDPAEDLDSEAARGFVLTVEKAVADKDHLVFRGKELAAIGSAFDLALVFSGGTLIAQGAPAELAAATRTFFLRLAGDPAAFLSACTELAWKPEALGPSYLRITLPDETGTHAAFAVAAETGVIITELSPVLLATEKR